MALEDDSSYFFDLRMVCGGYAYYVTHTVFVTYSNSGREVRCADPVSTRNFAKAANLYGRQVKKVSTSQTYSQWLYLRGWAFVPLSFARKHMQQWLRKAECIKAATNVFTDIGIVSPSALRHYTSGGRKQQVLSRDNGSCLNCGATEDDGAKLTMQHVLPFSKGGETTAQNLVTLCERCNQNFGTDEITELYEKAGLHFDYDPSIIKGFPTASARSTASELSDNLMQTRCEIW